MAYAAETKVPVSRSRAEIEALVTRAGATTFASMLSGSSAAILFELRKRRVQFELPLPSKSAFETRLVRGRKVRATEAQREAAWEQACRQRWRALALVIKAKLEAVEAGIVSFEEEFLAHIVVPGEGRVGQWLVPQLESAYQSGRMPPMLPGLPPAKESGA